MGDELGGEQTTANISKKTRREDMIVALGFKKAMSRWSVLVLASWFIRRIRVEPCMCFRFGLGFQAPPQAGPPLSHSLIAVTRQKRHRDA